MSVSTEFYDWFSDRSPTYDGFHAAPRTGRRVRRGTSR
jgi:hypothetical protein